MQTPDAPATAAPPAQPPIYNGVSALTHLGIIEVMGEDAVKFLQGQLTQDIALLSPLEACLAAFCNAKGRMQASFVVFKRSETEVLMLCSRDILAQTLKRLGMFVLRAKVKLTDASAAFTLLGLAGNAIEKIASGPMNTWAKHDFDAEHPLSHLIVLPTAAGTPRALWCTPAGTAAHASLAAAPALAPALWHWLEVQSGIAMVSAPIFEAFVPQMLNYESVGGVSFKKGCYPGQEVVARSQFRGTLKRRAYLAHAAAELTVGQALFHALDAEQPCGWVASGAPHPEGGYSAVVAIQTAAAADAADGRLRAGSATGPAVQLLPLPYALLDDI